MSLRLPFGRTPLAAALLAATLSLAAQPSAEGPVTLTFQVDARALEAPGMPGPETIGLRGSAPPLSWDRSVPMSDPRGNGFWEVTVTFPVFPDVLAYKFIADETDWELDWVNRLLPRGWGRMLSEPLPWDVNVLPPPEAFPPLAPEALRADLDLLERAFRELHPGLYRSLSPEEVDALFARYRARFSGPLSRGEAFLAFSQLAAALRCGHTWPNYLNQDGVIQQLVLEGGNKLPLAFRWVEGRAFVTRTAGFDEQVPSGSEILAIDGVPMARLRDTLMSAVPGEGGNDAQRLAALELTGLGRYEAWDALHPLVQPSAEGQYALRIRDPDGAERATVLPTITRAERRQAWRDAGLDFPERWEDLWGYRRTEDGIGILRLGTFSVWEMAMDWRGFLDSAFADLRRQEADALVIDLRGNGGGADEVLFVLARHLLREDARVTAPEDRLAYRTLPEDLAPHVSSWEAGYLDWGDAVVPAPDGGFTWAEAPESRLLRGSRKAFEGRVVLLTDAHNGSATFYLARLLRETGRAVLAGSPTGGSRRGLTGGQMVFLHLPRTGIEIDVPLIATRYPGEPDAPLEPDWPLPPTVAAARAVEDDVLPRVLERLRAER